MAINGFCIVLYCCLLSITNISTFSQYHRNIVSELRKIKTIPEFEKETFFSNVRKMPTSVKRKQTLVSIMKGEKR